MTPHIYTNPEITNLLNLGWRFIRFGDGTYKWALLDQSGMIVALQGDERFVADLAASEEPEDAQNPT